MLREGKMITYYYESRTFFSLFRTSAFVQMAPSCELNAFEGLLLLEGPSEREYAIPLCALRTRVGGGCARALTSIRLRWTSLARKGTIAFIHSSLFLFPLLMELQGWTTAPRFFQGTFYSFLYLKLKVYIGMCEVFCTPETSLITH